MPKFPLLFLLLISLGCDAPADNELLQYFSGAEPGENIAFFGLKDGWDGDTIPAHVVWTTLGEDLMDVVNPDRDSVEMAYQAGGSWLQDETHQICILNVTQYWWKFRYLLVYDLELNAFTAAELAAQFYGGDGGQVASSSYFLDHDGDGARDLLVRTSSHSLSFNPDSDDMDKRVEEGAYIRRWAAGTFQDFPLTDTAAVVTAFPVDWGW
jgi:hypothetical protein